MELTRAEKQVEIVHDLNLSEHVSFGLSIQRENFSRLHSLVKSLIGAVYVDERLDVARKIIYRLCKLNTFEAAASRTH